MEGEKNYKLATRIQQPGTGEALGPLHADAAGKLRRGGVLYVEDLSASDPGELEALFRVARVRVTQKLGVEVVFKEHVAAIFCQRVKRDDTRVVVKAVDGVDAVGEEVHGIFTNASKDWRDGTLGFDGRVFAHGNSDFVAAGHGADFFAKLVKSAMGVFLKDAGPFLKLIEAFGAEIIFYFLECGLAFFLDEELCPFVHRGGGNAFFSKLSGRKGCHKFPDISDGPGRPHFLLQ